MRGQELLNGDVRVDPSPKDGQAREARVLVRISEAKIDQLLKSVTDRIDRSPIDSHIAYNLNRDIRRLIEDFTGRRRRR